nr:40S ribosomal protein S10B [Cryptomonas paramecium]
MLISKKEKMTIYSQLFKFGVLVVKKNEKKTHYSTSEISSLSKIKVLKGLLSKDLVKETFSWQFYYFVLNDKGIKYIRKILKLPLNVFPLTYKKSVFK